MRINRASKRKGTLALFSAFVLAPLAANQARCADEGESPEARQHFMHQLDHPSELKNIGLGYWIELDRGKKKFHCNNRVRFHSGDRIRFHIISDADGYAYLLLKKGSTGGSGVLFPEGENDTSNAVKRGKDYPVPCEASLEFDKGPGVEKVELLFSRQKVNPDNYLSTPAEHRCCLAHSRRSAGESGMIITTKHKLTWDEPEAVLIADHHEQAGKTYDTPKELAELVDDHSFITVVDRDTKGVLSVEVSLAHR